MIDREADGSDSLEVGSTIGPYIGGVPNLLYRDS
jgi:hypothetical protein